MTMSSTQHAPLHTPHGVRFSLRSVVIAMTVLAVAAAIAGPWVRGLTVQQQWRLVHLLVASLAGIAIAVGLHRLSVSTALTELGSDVRTIGADLSKPVVVEDFKYWPLLRPLDGIVGSIELTAWLLFAVLYVYLDDAPGPYYVLIIACALSSAFFQRQLMRRINYVVVGSKGVFLPSLRRLCGFLRWAGVRLTIGDDGAICIDYEYATPTCIAMIRPPQSQDLREFLDTHRIRYYTEKV